MSEYKKGCIFFYHTGIVVVSGLVRLKSISRARPPHITPFFWIASAPKKFLDPIPSSSRKDKVWGQVNGSGEVGGRGVERMEKEEKIKVEEKNIRFIKCSSKYVE